MSIRYAFDSCSALTNITLPASVTSIGPSAFMGCVRLTSITIPASVTNIGDYAFCNCHSLTSVFFAGNAPVTDPTAFNGDSTTFYYLPGTTGWSNTLAGRPTVLWNPLIQAGDGSFGLSNNQIGFNITGTTNIPIKVEACANLACPVWTPLQTLKLSNCSFYFSEPVQTNSPARFYRITSP